VGAVQRTRPLSFSRRAAGWFALALLAPLALARAERMERLFAGPELRLRLDSELGPRYELSLPHGLTGAQLELSARLGIVLPARDAPLSFPLTAGLRYLPVSGRYRPLLGVDIGGYFSQGRGPRVNESTVGPEWTWSMRALSGAQLALARGVSLRVFVDAMWAQAPEDARIRAQVFSGLGAGCELQVAFAPPRWHLFEMLLRGKSAPEGW
jgi:hypothetical protein